MEQAKDQELQVGIEGRNDAKDWYSWEFWDDSQLKAQFKEMKKVFCIFSIHKGKAGPEPKDCVSYVTTGACGTKAKYPTDLSSCHRYSPKLKEYLITISLCHLYHVNHSSNMSTEYLEHANRWIFT